MGLLLICVYEDHATRSLLETLVNNASVEECDNNIRRSYIGRFHKRRKFCCHIRCSSWVQSFHLLLRQGRQAPSMCETACTTQEHFVHSNGNKSRNLTDSQSTFSFIVYVVSKDHFTAHRGSDPNLCGPTIVTGNGQTTDNRIF